MASSSQWSYRQALLRQDPVQTVQTGQQATLGNSQSKLTSVGKVDPKALEAVQCRQTQELWIHENERDLLEIWPTWHHGENQEFPSPKEEPVSLREKWMTKMDALMTSVKKKAPPSGKKAYALDCEMVAVRLPGSTKNVHKAASVWVVDSDGYVVYKTYISQKHPISNYFTWISGIRRRDLKGAPSLKLVQEELYGILRGNILVGHGLKGDLEALEMDHPIADQRDTQRFVMRNLPFGESKTNLKLMASIHLGQEIQQGSHNTADDAVATMGLYLLYVDYVDAQPVFFEYYI